MKEPNTSEQSGALERQTDPISRYPELAALTERELEVFYNLLTDKTQLQIASKIFVSPSAVHFHRKNIYRKLDIGSRMQLMIKYKDIQP